MIRPHSLFFPLILTAVVAQTGCGRHNQEPPRTIPENWEKWEREGVSFRFPKELALATRVIDIDDVQIFLETRETPSKLILCLEFGETPPSPTMSKTKSLGQSKSTRIGHFDAERFGPGVDGAGTFSEGLLDLGGKGHFLRAHFCYSNLNAAEQEMAETIVASLNKSH